MLKKVFSINDSVSRIFLNPFTSTNQATALRDFRSVCVNPQTEIGRSPGDYTIYEIATFNDETGELTPTTPFVNLGNGNQFPKEV